MLAEDNIKIRSALISVFHKDFLEPIVRELDGLGAVIYSTGGTQSFIKALGVDVVPVERITSCPPILGGRVKTLHPRVFGGILHRRKVESDLAQMDEYSIPHIDLVVVDLYPFEHVADSGVTQQEVIEKIDIGGVSLIRAAAKNFNDVVVVPAVDYYDEFLAVIKRNQGSTHIDDRKYFATRAFEVSSHYDTAIFNYFNKDCSVNSFKQSIHRSKSLRYGENPHQKGIFYGALDDVFDKLNGKELSYNNLLDVDSAVSILSEFKDEPTFAILKHSNACGVASDKTILKAYKKALVADPVSAFGGVLIANSSIDVEMANEINKLFCEVVIAPSFDKEALGILKSKKNRIILVQRDVDISKIQFRTVLNGVLLQDRDLKTDASSNLQVVTDKDPTDGEREDLVFASKICKHTKSNAIVLVKGKRLIASGIGQTSRVDALKQAIAKAKYFGFDLKGGVMASDAFFPFSDCVQIAHQEGISSVIQPGGSIRDELSIDYCNRNGISMVFTGIRHFKH